MRFKDQPIARKALTLGLVPASCAVIIVTAAFALAVFLTTRGNLIRDNEALVAVVADNISAAVAFEDAQTAFDLLRGFRARPDVNTICVYDASGRLLAAYRAPRLDCLPTDTIGTGTADSLLFVRPVTVGDRRVG